MTKDAYHDVEVLKRELVGLFQHIQRIRKEIAAIRRPGASEDEDHFTQMSDELDAIVSATEGATNTIMENVEEMEDLVNEVRPHVNDAEALALLDKFPEKTGNIFEACAFQDITGQRITKVVNSLQFVEARVNALINMWGPEELTKVAPASMDAEKKKDEYKKYLNGPQLEGHGVSQADVDALFGDSGAPETPSADATPAPAPTPPPQQAKPAPKPAAKPDPKPEAKADPKPAPAAKPAPPPAPPKGDDGEEDGGGPALGQDDIDKLFG